jgi:PTS system nitrogen regulatory IIA component
MKIAEFLREDLILDNLTAQDKAGALAELCGALARVHGLDAAKLTDVLLEREKLGSTGIGEGVAIPHGKFASVPGLIAAFGRSKAGVDFQAIDGKPTHLFFVLFAPENSAGIHLKALARISRLFRNAALRQTILDAPDAKGIFQIIAEEDAKF